MPRLRDTFAFSRRTADSFRTMHPNAEPHVEPVVEPPSSSEDEVIDVRQRSRTRGGGGGGAVGAPNNGQLMANAGALLVAFLAAVAFLSFVLQAAVVGVGVVHPAWQTYKALSLDDMEVDSGGDDEDKDYVPGDIVRGNWLSYWVLAALLYTATQCLTLPLGAVSLGIPIPAALLPALLVPALLFLTRDNARNSRRLYDDVARPALRYLEGHVDDSVDAALAQVEYWSSLAMVRAYGAVEPYTAQFRRAAQHSLRTLHNSDVGTAARRRSKRS